MKWICLLLIAAYIACPAEASYDDDAAAVLSLAVATRTVSVAHEESELVAVEVPQEKPAAQKKDCGCSVVGECPCPKCECPAGRPVFVRFGEKPPDGYVPLRTVSQGTPTPQQHMPTFQPQQAMFMGGGFGGGGFGGGCRGGS